MIEFKNPSTVIKLTLDQAQNIGIDINNPNGELKTVGPWGMVKSFKALCISKTYKKDSLLSKVEKTVLHGCRTLSNPKQNGYFLDGYVSVGGKKYSAFTGSQLFEVDGKLIDVATIQTRID